MRRAVRPDVIHVDLFVVPTCGCRCRMKRAGKSMAKAKATSASALLFSMTAPREPAFWNRNPETPAHPFVA